MATTSPSYHADETVTTPTTPEPSTFTVSDLKNGSGSTSPTLWYRIHVLLYDLGNFTNPSSHKRLDGIADPSYVGEPYFTSPEATMIKKTKINSQTVEEHIEECLKERLQRRNKKRVESADFQVCAAHDVAPILARLLEIDLKMLIKDKQFVQLVEQRGLDLGEESWAGLAKKSFSPKKKHK